MTTIVPSGRRRRLLVVATTAVLVATDVMPNANAQTTAPATPAPQMVSGLPDFTNLVDQVGPAVVNVEADINGGAKDQPATDDDEDMPGLQHVQRYCNCNNLLKKSNFQPE